MGQQVLIAIVKNLKVAKFNSISVNNPIKDCCGQTQDNAPNLLEKYEFEIFVPFAAHSLNLVDLMLMKS